MDIADESIERLARAIRHVENRVANISEPIDRYSQSIGDDGAVMLLQVGDSLPDVNGNYLSTMYLISPMFANIPGESAYLRTPDGSILANGGWYIGRRETYNTDGLPVYVATVTPLDLSSDVVTNVCVTKKTLSYSESVSLGVPSGTNLITDINVETTNLIFPLGTYVGDAHCQKSPQVCCPDGISGCPPCPVAPFTWNILIEGFTGTGVQGTCCELFNGLWQLGYLEDCIWVDDVYGQSPNADIMGTACACTTGIPFSLGLLWFAGVWSVNICTATPPNGVMTFHLIGEFDCMGVNTFTANLTNSDSCSGSVTITIWPA